MNPFRECHCKKCGGGTTRLWVLTLKQRQKLQKVKGKDFRPFFQCLSNFLVRPHGQLPPKHTSLSLSLFFFHKTVLFFLFVSLGPPRPWEFPQNGVLTEMLDWPSVLGTEEVRRPWPQKYDCPILWAWVNSSMYSARALWLASSHSIHSGLTQAEEWPCSAQRQWCPFPAQPSGSWEREGGCWFQSREEGPMGEGCDLLGTASDD